MSKGNKYKQINVKQNTEIKVLRGAVKFHFVLLLKSAISRRFQTTFTPLHSTSGTTYPATYCDKTVLHHPEEVNCKTKAHRRGFVYTIPQEALPAKRAEQLENIT